MSPYSEVTLWIRAFITLEAFAVFVGLALAQRYNGQFLQRLKWVFFWNAVALAWYLCAGMARLFAWAPWIEAALRSDLSGAVWIPYALSLLWLHTYVIRLLWGPPRW